MATSKPTTGETNFGYASAGISAISSIAGALVATSAFKAQEESKTANVRANINSELDSYEMNAYKLEEDYKLLDGMFADKVSERALQGMKDQATMRAAAAETGTSGGSTGEAIGEAFVNEALDIAIINKQRKSSLVGVLRRSDQARANAVNTFKSLASGGTSVHANTMLSGFSGATSALGGLISTMPDSIKASIFDTKANAVDINNTRTA